MRWCALCWPSSCIAPGRSSPGIRTTASDPRPWRLCVGVEDDDTLRAMSVIYLASRSPRRRELLAQIGIRFEPLLFRDGARADPDTDESVKDGELPDDYVVRVTQQK